MSKSSRKTKTKSSPESRDDRATRTDDSRSIYADYVIWTSKQKPQWHPLKKTRYIFFRMMSGVTVTDALREIHWTPSEFWHQIDLKRKDDPILDEYKRAKSIQGRAFADSVIQVADGRDRQTRQSLLTLRKMIKRSLKRASKQKSVHATKAVIDGLLAQINENEHRIINRNKVQIDAKKWMAKSVNPNEFSDRSAVAVSGSIPTGDTGDTPTPIKIQFIAPDGSVVDPFAHPPEQE